MQEIIIFVVGLVAGFLGATVGSGGMLAVPALLLLGFSPQSAVAINTVGDIGAFTSAVARYWKSKKIDWGLAILLASIAAISSIVGAQIMVRLETGFLETFIGVMILVFLPFFFFSKDIGIKQTKSSKFKEVTGLILYSLLAIVGAIVGAGSATVVLMIMMYFFGYKIIRGYATNAPAELISSIICTVIYAFHGFIPLWPAAIIFIGMLIGGFLGANTALGKGNAWVKNLFIIVVITFVVKILFF